MKFDHVGITNETVRDDSVFYAPNKVWITDSSKHPFSVEWLRYEKDSEVPEPVKATPHIGFIVESIEASSDGLTLLMDPFVVGDRRVGFFQTKDGAVLELIEEL